MTYFPPFWSPLFPPSGVGTVSRVFSRFEEGVCFHLHKLPGGYNINIHRCITLNVLVSKLALCVLLEDEHIRVTMPRTLEAPLYRPFVGLRICLCSFPVCVIFLGNSPRSNIQFMYVKVTC